MFRHPFIERDSLGLVGDHVTLEQGTGAVHTAPGHGQEDYVIGMQYGLPVYCPVDGTGRFFEAEGAAGKLPAQLLGKTVWEANPLVISILNETGALLAVEQIEHSYPHCWRCHNATIFPRRRPVVHRDGQLANGLRQNALRAIQAVKWLPEWGEERISNMVAGRPDWCISRQRVWGVPIVVWKVHCSTCREPLTDRKILDGVVDLFEQHSADVWFERSAAELVPPGTPCKKCGDTEFAKENDILDVWFDSGSSHLAVLTEENGLRWPADLYLEGGDQYRGWFQSSLLIGVGLKGDAPYRATATHGWTLDGQGRAMHKSLGNDIPPEDVIKDYGADVLRLWCGSVEFTEDVTLTPTILTRLSEAYRKLRNTFRYVLGNISDFDPCEAMPCRAANFWNWTSGSWIRAADLWWRGAGPTMMSSPSTRSTALVYDFATVDLSSIYFDVLKDRGCTARLGAEIAGAPQRPNRPPPAGARAGSALRAHPQLHDGRSMGPSRTGRQRPMPPCSRTRRS